ncbi:unnamed protein product [Moneuplotes crassus]|uniref:C2H2-type domain-containing protein n=1 Tax=Euplotes crassus TaxID=5936 RepID=A0AAD1XI61_EUPCR|nr:unnamed protein product [Moneuplotes crassus]
MKPTFGIFRGGQATSQPSDDTSDKENKKYDFNATGRCPDGETKQLEGLKSLGSDYFLDKFEDIRNFVKESSIQRVFKPHVQHKYEESKFTEDSNSLPEELLPLNQLIKSINSKSLKWRWLKLCLIIVTELPEYDPDIDYQKMFWEIHSSNQLMLQELQDLENSQKIFPSHVDNLKVIFIFCPVQEPSNYSESLGENIGRKKHIRRTAKEITKNQNCPYQDCNKVYGSEGSLNLHMKLKHGAGNKTDREKLSKTLVIQYGNKKSLPSEITINLPPGILEQVCKEYNFNLTKSQLRELQNEAENRFKAYCVKCKKLGTLDPSTGFPSVEKD